VARREGGEEECIQNFSVETFCKTFMWKTKKQMGDIIKKVVREVRCDDRMLMDLP